jgi:tryptophan 2,3-dioxygenase
VSVAGYSEYLRLDELLSLQSPRTRLGGPELAFIVVHQVYELWFKLILEELEAAVRRLDDDDAGGALAHLRRVHEIERLMIEQMVLVDHLEPGSFAALRGALGTASAGESQQYAAIESLSTRAPLRDHATAPHDLWSSFCAFARRLGLDMPAGDRGEDLAHRRTATLIDVYERGRRPLVELCEALLDHDHAFCVWRHRHCLAAARHIGANPGTGGSSGVDYLQQRAGRRFYPDLWAVRTDLVFHAGGAPASGTSALSAGR